MDPVLKERKRIAWVSPLPPQRTGIANYSYWLIKSLKPLFEIDLFTDCEEPAAELRGNSKIYHLAELANRLGDYDEVVYHIGNNSRFHKVIYELAWDYPGTIVLHDFNISAFLFECFLANGGRLFKEAAAAYGSNVDDPASLPMSHAIVARSKKVIVHHRWARSQFLDRAHISVIPHFAKLNLTPTTNEIESFRQRIGLKRDHFVICCLGFVNSNKLPELQIQVAKSLLNDGYPVQLVFAGEPSNDIANLVAETQSGKYRQNILFTGFQTELDYFSAIWTADIIVNLRKPSMGEASGTLMQALAAAKPTIISDANQYREFPDNVCWKLAHDQSEEAVLSEYLKTLMGDRRVRAALAANAATYVENVLTLERVSAQWAQTILK